MVLLRKLEFCPTKFLVLFGGEPVKGFGGEPVKGNHTNFIKNHKKTDKVTNPKMLMTKNHIVCHCNAVNTSIMVVWYL